MHWAIGTEENNISENKTQNVFLRSISIDFLMMHGGIERNLEINRIVEVREDLSFMHIDTKNVHEVYCGEEYSFICNVIRNYKSVIKITFNGENFTTDGNDFILTVIFPNTGVFDIGVELESSGIKAHQRISFIVDPSFSVSLFHYKYCLPLAFLKICNHTTEDARVKSLSILNQDFRISGYLIQSNRFTHTKKALLSISEKTL